MACPHNRIQLWKLGNELICEMSSFPIKYGSMRTQIGWFRSICRNCIPNNRIHYSLALTLLWLIPPWNLTVKLGKLICNTIHSLSNKGAQISDWLQTNLDAQMIHYTYVMVLVEINIGFCLMVLCWFDQALTLYRLIFVENALICLFWATIIWYSFYRIVLKPFQFSAV